MSKSKSKSKSKQLTFPDNYWRPEFEIYTFYPEFFDRGKELLAVALQEPPQDGNTIAAEVAALLKKQQQLNQNLNERDRRLAEIEWEANHLSRSYQTTLLIGPDAYSNTWQLMNTMSDLALIPLMHFKKKFARARPNQIEPSIQPLIEVPGHPAYPSGHATQNFLIAHLLSEVIGDDAELIARVFAIARRVAENREYAGVHYASDTRAGEDLAREIFPIMRQALARPIKAAIEEWQELELEEDKTGARAVQPVAPYGGLQDAGAPMSRDDPFPESHFHDHQWNLRNLGQRGGKPGVDINVLGAWEELKIWREGAAGQEPPVVRVALIDLAIDFDHPALARRFDYDHACNLEYPNMPKRPEDGDKERLRALGWTDEDVKQRYEDVKRRYKEAFGSFSSAHAVACDGIIAADAMQLGSADGDSKQEPGCLGIAPHCLIVPYRAMTLTEPVLHKRQALARAVLQASTGVTFREVVNGGHLAPRWTVTGQGQHAHVLFLPLPLEPLTDGSHDDPLPLALAFAATKIPVIIPSGNKGTSSLGYPWEAIRKIQAPQSLDRLSQLFDLDLKSVRSIFGDIGLDEQPPKQLEDKRIQDFSRLPEDTAIIYVGACNDQGGRSRYSQYGEGLTIVAPSDEVLPSPQGVKDGAQRPPSIATTDLQGIGGYMQDQNHYTLSDNEFGFGGTSAAAAQVAGVVALMLQANRQLKPTEVREILRDTARVKREKPEDLLIAHDKKTPSKPSLEFGYGLVDAAAAVKRAKTRAEQRAA
jgi:subtilisin family serine protease